MLRSRTIREGSVGLLALVGIILFGAIALWLRGINLKEESYKVVGEFPNVKGIQVGDSVRYRGLKVGRITDIQPGTNGVDIVMEIFSSNLLIPKNALIQASSSGLIGETFVDIVPQTQLPEETQAMNPLSQNCDSSIIICNEDRLEGQPGITLDDLLPLMFQMTSLYSDPRFFDNINAAVQNTSLAADEVAKLSKDLSLLVGDVQGQLNNFSIAADAITQLTEDTSTQIASTAEQYKRTATQISQLTESVNNLVTQNRGNLVTTLDNIKTTSDRLQNLTLQLEKTFNTANTEQLIQNLATLTANAAEASANLKDISATFSDPANLVTLQQTLDSARVTFVNAQKITSDLEQVTGDPAFIKNFRNLVNGLSNLVSSTEQLEQQVHTTQILEPVKQELSLLTSTNNLSWLEKSIKTEQINNYFLLENKINHQPNLSTSPHLIPNLKKQPKP
jgi:phospholipid/cholesterol/gamma-HCH transport system substrate-binding protein